MSSSAVYEWNYSAQMIEIRLAEAAGIVDRDRLRQEIFSSERFLIKPAVAAGARGASGAAPVLLIDELDRTDEAFEAFLLEVLSDFQVTIPELGTIKAEEPPIVVITSNRTREVHDALKRRCLYHWVGYPDAVRERAIIRARRPTAPEALSQEVVGFVQALRCGELFKSPGVAETLDWVSALRGARCHRPRSADGQRYARRAAEISGRHRPARGLPGAAADRAGEERPRASATGLISFGKMVRKASPAGRDKRLSSSEPPDEIQESLIESFPASDPPAWTAARVGEPSRRPTRPHAGRAAPDKPKE